MFGQGWAQQVNLGYLYPPDTVRRSLSSIWKYCWAPDIGPQTRHHPPDRWYALPGDAGLFVCTWPKSKHLGPLSTRYRDEAWTGIEYQVAGHMAWEGMLTECLTICRAVHERYHPSKRNPFNEIECGDHYTRAMASWGVLIGLTGFEYHGPAGHIGFAPRITPKSFKVPFTAAEGWGSYSQRVEGDSLVAKLAVKWGRLKLRSLRLNLPPEVLLVSVAAKVGTDNFDATGDQQDTAVTLRFEREILLESPDALDVTLRFS
jgi:non-lysosomal glucosylceramidase